MKQNDFHPQPDDTMVRFTIPNGWIELNQRWMETCKIGKFRTIMKSIDKANDLTKSYNFILQERGSGEKAFNDRIDQANRQKGKRK